MTLLARVVEILKDRGIPCALIGAEALALRGVSRATADRDLLATDPQTLEPALWAGGPQDAWDIAQLLNGDDRETVIGEVRERLRELPAECRTLWENLLLA